MILVVRDTSTFFFFLSVLISPLSFINYFELFSNYSETNTGCSYESDEFRFGSSDRTLAAGLQT